MDIYFIFLNEGAKIEKKLKSMVDFTLPEGLVHLIGEIQEFFRNREFKKIITSKEKFSCVRLNKFDNLIRKKYKKEFVEIIRIVYILDAYISIAKAARINKFTFPEYLTESKPKLTITGLFHPFLENAVS